jgi:protein gp37
VRPGSLDATAYRQSQVRTAAAISDEGRAGTGCWTPREVLIHGLRGVSAHRHTRVVHNGAMATSAIEWTEVTWNPTTGCDRISPGCERCYAQVLAKRLKAMGQPKYQRDGDPRTSGPGFGITTHPDTLTDPLSWSGSRLVFVNSMSDLFHDGIEDDFIRAVTDVMEATPQHTYQVLTKRSRRLLAISERIEWPPNVWLGVSVESQRYAFRIDHLREVAAAVRFVSAEPLLGRLGLSLDGIGWVIVGGESGSTPRPIRAEWVRSLREQCLDAGVPFFFKQWGGRTPKSGGRILDGRTWDQIPVPLQVVGG